MKGECCAMKNEGCDLWGVEVWEGVFGLWKEVKGKWGFGTR